MGNPVVHWEFWSKEPEKISNFYAKVFDWKIEHMPELNYRVVNTGGEGGLPCHGTPVRLPSALRSPLPTIKHKPQSLLLPRSKTVQMYYWSPRQSSVIIVP